MSLRVKIVEVTEVDGKADRLINIVFRGTILFRVVRFLGTQSSRSIFIPVSGTQK